MTYLLQMRVKRVRCLSGSSRASVSLLKSWYLPRIVSLTLFDVVSKANWAKKARRDLLTTALRYVPLLILQSIYLIHIFVSS